MVAGEWLRLPALVPFWKPPNITESTIRIRISSTTHIRQPPSLERGRHRRRGSPLLTQAQKNTTAMLDGMLTSLGFQHITVTFAS